MPGHDKSKNALGCIVLILGLPVVLANWINDRVGIPSPVTYTVIGVIVVGTLWVHVWAQNKKLRALQIANIDSMTGVQFEQYLQWRDPSEWTGLNCSSASFSWFFLLGFLVVLSIKWATNRSPDLSIIAPGQCVARMPGTGPLRRSSVLARQKAIVGKSLVEAARFHRPWFVFVSYWLHALKLLLLGKLGRGVAGQR